MDHADESTRSAATAIARAVSNSAASRAAAADAAAAAAPSAASFARDDDDFGFFDAAPFEARADGNAPPRDQPASATSPGGAASHPTFNARSSSAAYRSGGGEGEGGGEGDGGGERLSPRDMGSSLGVARDANTAAFFAARAARTSSRGSEGTVASAAAMSRSAGTSRGGVGPAAAATARSWSAVYVSARRDGGVVGIGDESWSWSADSGAWTMPSGWAGCAGRSWSDQRASRVARRGRGACGSNAGGGGWGGRRHRRTCSRAWAVGCRSQPRRGGGGAWTHSPPPSPRPHRSQRRRKGWG